MPTQDNIFPSPLPCPQCGETYTHLDSVIYHDRLPSEDGVPVAVLMTGVSVVYEPDRVLSWDESVATPPIKSSRRHDIAILINGECGHRTWLYFIQHKGETYVEWVKAEVIDFPAG